MSDEDQKGTQKGMFRNLMGRIGKVVGGIIALIIALPLVWFNEGFNHKTTKIQTKSHESRLQIQSSDARDELRKSENRLLDRNIAMATLRLEEVGLKPSITEAEKFRTVNVKTGYLESITGEKPFSYQTRDEKKLQKLKVSLARNLKAQELLNAKDPESQAYGVQMALGVSDDQIDQAAATWLEQFHRQRASELDKDSFVGLLSQASDRLMNKGFQSNEERLQSDQEINTVKNWFFRVLGLLILAGGFTLLFNPLISRANEVPFLGNLVKFGSLWTSILLGGIFSTLTIGLVWIFHNPFVGISFLALTALLIAVFILAPPKAKRNVSQST